LVPRSPQPPPSLPPLPFTLDVWKHRHEHLTKSTALHAKILCPQDVRLWNYPDEVLEYEECADKVLVLYPSPVGCRIVPSHMRTCAK
jgi:hypothetical protein